MQFSSLLSYTHPLYVICLIHNQYYIQWQWISYRRFPFHGNVCMLERESFAKHLKDLLSNHPVNKDKIRPLYRLVGSQCFNPSGKVSWEDNGVLFYGIMKLIFAWENDSLLRSHASLTRTGEFYQNISCFRISKDPIWLLKIMWTFNGLLVTFAHPLHCLFILSLYQDQLSSWQHINFIWWELHPTIINIFISLLLKGAFHKEKIYCERPQKGQ